MRTVLYPGSFDPVTAGHMDLIRRASTRFEQVIVGILYNPDKPNGVFSPEERVALIMEAAADLPNVTARVFSGLLVDAARACEADAVIRGLRTSADLEAELEMARLNRQIGGVETLLLASAPEVVHISASMVRVIGANGGDLRGLVPEGIRSRVAEALKHR